MADPLSARQQIVDKIKESSNVLVTVSQDPSVDQLSAALGLTIMLNNLSKHATAVVSGNIPPAITFLEPEKTFEGTVDSLRDFIIALDKEKADHLRYKVDGDVVKIFITPYKTTISEEDLDFSQGDYNVELVLALGVEDEAHLDKALEAHGKILHDATVATVSAGGAPSKLGTIDWRDDTASSLSEMLVSLSEAIKGDKALLDEQSSTALLTGIVAATDRFSNEKTSSKVMTMSAQLMAAGANQQLIATKLQEARAIGAGDSNDDESSKAEAKDGTTPLEEDTSTKVDKSSEDETKTDDTLGGMAISHEKEGDIDEVADQVDQEGTEMALKEAQAAFEEQAAPPVESSDPTAAAEQQLAEELQATVPAATSPDPSLADALRGATEQLSADEAPQQSTDPNASIVNHGELDHVSGNSTTPPINSSVGADPFEPPTVDVFNSPAASGPTLAEIDTQARAQASPVVDTTALPPLPDFSTLPPPPSIPIPPPVSGAQAAPVDPNATTGALSPDKLASLFSTPMDTETPTQAPPAQNSTDPGQFKIPGQD